MAVRIDIEAFRESIPPEVREAAERLREDDGIGEPEPAGGGVQALVQAPDGAFHAWVGIVDGAVIGRCACAAAGDELCAHAAALMLTAVTGGMPFSSSAEPPLQDDLDGPDRAVYAEAVRRLAPEDLAELVVTYALDDDAFAARLLDEADMLPA
ncbi:hypothetical protein [Phytohabitans houttuyneae]|uniref:SWIM-type domain-containing protein n=1 Tax=Phytohabitans houttuyneae TaxID=1076126 RepID=A0A6V8KL51_9ACTN|nr:hypothetical protein [Phytohabitans houttuyneae]GFJ81395.1 hypothetical protein Phou_055750 [Phytohabitans houttuyneae]